MHARTQVGTLNDLLKLRCASPWVLAHREVIA